MVSPGDRAYSHVAFTILAGLVDKTRLVFLPSGATRQCKYNFLAMGKKWVEWT